MCAFSRLVGLQPHFKAALPIGENGIMLALIPLAAVTGKGPQAYARGYNPLREGGDFETVH
jgi:hypothetical protein